MLARATLAIAQIPAAYSLNSDSITSFVAYSFMFRTSIQQLKLLEAFCEEKQ